MSRGYRDRPIHRYHRSKNRHDDEHGCTGPRSVSYGSRTLRTWHHRRKTNLTRQQLPTAMDTKTDRFDAMSQVFTNVRLGVRVHDVDLRGRDLGGADLSGLRADRVDF